MVVSEFHEWCARAFLDRRLTADGELREPAEDGGGLRALQEQILAQDLAPCGWVEN